LPPTISIVVPCKSNERTIRATVESLLAQDYTLLEEVILVGDVDDSTWTALGGITDPRLVIIEQESPGGRDPNVKRHTGICKSRSELIALSDSDIVMPPWWLSRAVTLITERGVECVAGGMRSIHRSFWGRYVDYNRLGAKTPPIGTSYMVTAGNFGRRGRKPPVTANVICTRRLYDTCALDVTWLYGYEDYEWFWRLARRGNEVLFTSELDGWHHHRRGLVRLAREYLRASDGCSILVKTHPSCPLSRKRRWQAVTLSLTGVGLTLLSVILAVNGWGLLVAGAAALAALLAGGWEYARSRRVESFCYPLVTSILGSVFLFGLVKGLIRRSGRSQPPGDAAIPGRVHG
jgi:glycosyltransferase involved in cell wall biosynthesis